MKSLKNIHLLELIIPFSIFLFACEEKKISEKSTWSLINEEMRTSGSEDLYNSLCDKLGQVHKEGIALYGSDNNMRLTGLHETQSIEKFSYGVSDRGASIRIPIYTVENNWNGYLEDRRPASNADPYKIINHIVSTLK